MAEQQVVTPWEVSGNIDYTKLVKEFGTQQISEQLLARLKKHTKDIHPYLRRKIFFPIEILTGSWMNMKKATHSTCILAEALLSRSI